MHILQPKHIKLNNEEIKKFTSELNISLSQLPKIKINDPALPENCDVSDVVKVERISDGKKIFYYRVVSV